MLIISNYYSINQTPFLSTKANELTARSIKNNEKIEDTENSELDHSESF